jgi:hypothetical protein
MMTFHKLFQFFVSNIRYHCALKDNDCSKWNFSNKIIKGNWNWPDKNDKWFCGSVIGRVVCSTNGLWSDRDWFRTKGPEGRNHGRGRTRSLGASRLTPRERPKIGPTDAKSIENRKVNLKSNIISILQICLVWLRSSIHYQWNIYLFAMYV